MGLFVYFGVPGSGKTTFAARVVKRNLLRGFETYSNVDIKGAILYNARDLGQVDISDCDLIIDEASIEFNNRNYKSLPQYTIKWLKLYRHYGVRNIYVFSQSYEDMDVTIRRLADRLYIIRRSLLPYVHTVKPISVRIGIDKDTHQIVQHYFFPLLSTRFFFAPAYWQMFDSWSAPALPGGSFIRVGISELVPPAGVTDPKFLRRLGKTLRWNPLSQFYSSAKHFVLHGVDICRSMFLKCARSFSKRKKPRTR